MNSFDPARPWTLGELEARYGDTEAVLGSLRRLSRYGLTHRMGFYVVASSAAIFHRHMLQRFAPEPSDGSLPGTIGPACACCHSKNLRKKAIALMEEQPDCVDLLACDRMEWEVLQLMLLSSDDRPWWKVEQVVGETSDPITALDAIAELCEVGLLRRKGEFVVITCAALRYHQLITHPPRAEWVRPTP